MDPQAPPGDEPIYSIGAAAKIVDVPVATIRAWEERYRVVKPVRSGGAQRLYSRNQIEQLKYIKSQIESGASAADAHRLLGNELDTSRVPPGQAEKVYGDIHKRRNAIANRLWLAIFFRHIK